MQSRTLPRHSSLARTNRAQGETLYPGEIIGPGTVGGGCGLELLRFLQSGNVVELEIEKIGVVRNRVLTPSNRES